MFAQVMFTQLRWTRMILLFTSVATFLTPVIAWWIGGTRVLNPESPRAVMSGFDTGGPMLVLIGILAAFLLAVYPWTMDAAARHTLPLSLPITWRRYVAMRFAAGALLLLLPALTLWFGALLVVAQLELPPTLRAYPGMLALRFLAALMLAYSMTFALQYLAGRRSAAVALGLLVGGVLLSAGLAIIGDGGVTGMLFDWLVEFPGPLAVFASDWKLIDV